MINNVVLMGALTRDPDMHYNGENAIARFSLAISRNYKDADGNYQADFPNVVCFGKSAEFVEKYFHKGNIACVIGSLRTGSYTDKDGVKRYTTDVYASSVTFGERKKDSNKEDDAPVPEEKKSGTKKKAPAPAPVDDDDELPFN